MFANFTQAVTGETDFFLNFLLGQYCTADQVTYYCTLAKIQNYWICCTKIARLAKYYPMKNFRL